jgi:hypothetical protein
MIKLLISLGASTTLTDKTGRTPYDIAEFLLKKELKELKPIKKIKIENENISKVLEKKSDILNNDKKEDNIDENIDENKEENKDENKEEDIEENNIDESEDYRKSMVVPIKAQKEMKEKIDKEELVKIFEKDFSKEKFDSENESFKSDSPLDKKLKLFDKIEVKKDKIFDDVILDMLDCDINDKTIPILYRPEVNVGIFHLIKF